MKFFTEYFWLQTVNKQVIFNSQVIFTSDCYLAKVQGFLYWFLTYITRKTAYFFYFVLYYNSPSQYHTITYLGITKFAVCCWLHRWNIFSTISIICSTLKLYTIKSAKCFLLVWFLFWFGDLCLRRYHQQNCFSTIYCKCLLNIELIFN